MHKDDLSNALEENAEEETPPLTHLLEAFGPGTFATLEEMARYFFFNFILFQTFLYSYIFLVMRRMMPNFGLTLLKASKIGSKAKS